MSQVTVDLRTEKHPSFSCLLVALRLANLVKKQLIKKHPLLEFKSQVYYRPTGPEKRKFSITSDSFFYFYYGLFGGRKEANRRGFIQIGPCKLLKGAPKDNFFLELRYVALLK